jgi:hypothetical protein
MHSQPFSSGNGPFSYTCCANHAREIGTSAYTVQANASGTINVM